MHTYLKDNNLSWQLKVKSPVSWFMQIISNCGRTCTPPSPSPKQKKKHLKSSCFYLLIQTEEELRLSATRWPPWPYVWRRHRPHTSGCSPVWCPCGWFCIWHGGSPDPARPEEEQTAKFHKRYKHIFADEKKKKNSLSHVLRKVSWEAKTMSSTALQQQLQMLMANPEHGDTYK